MDVETQTTLPASGETGAEPATAPETPPGRVYTEEEFNRHMAAARRKWEAEVKKAAEEAAKRAQMDEAERLKAEKQELEARIAAEAAARLAAERKAALAGKVADPNAALKLLEDRHLDEAGNVRVDALLADYPFLAATKPSSPAWPPQGSGAARTYTLDDLARMSPEEINQHWGEIIQQQRKNR